MAARKRVLTEADWRRLFEARCRAKRGQHVSDEDRALFDAAFKSDPKRYGAMDEDVFNATVPAGSGAKWKKR